MIMLVEALNYRCLRYAYQPLDRFHVLVGPNASGKTTFLDVVGFLGDIVSLGLDQALTDRTPNPQDLLFGRQGTCLELAVEAMVPQEVRDRSGYHDFDTVRYQVALGFDETDRQFEFKAETLVLKKSGGVIRRDLLGFPDPRNPPETLLINIKQRNNKALVSKASGGNDTFYHHGVGTNRKWTPSFKLGPRRSALGNLPADAASFPVSTWFREYITDGVQRFSLNSRAIRQPSPPHRAAGFMSDGSNISWAVRRLRESSPEKHAQWIQHMRTSLHDLEDIHAVEREEDRHCYMVFSYSGGLKVPSWLVSDGTLRLTGLTLPAYLTNLEGVYLIEEPENGIHPKAVSTVCDSLSSIYNAQVLLATHSPVVLNAAAEDSVLCFSRDDTGATDIVAGSDHPNLRHWRRQSDLGTLLAAGVLG